jgi:hypothetical protein
LTTFRPLSIVFSCSFMSLLSTQTLKSCGGMLVWWAVGRDERHTGKRYF